MWFYLEIGLELFAAIVCGAAAVGFALVAVALLLG